MNEPAALSSTLSKSFKLAFAEHGTDVSAEELAVLGNVTAHEAKTALSDPAKFMELQLFSSAHARSGKRLPARVDRLIAKALDVIEDHLTQGCDVDAVLELVKPLIKLRDGAERSRLAEVGPAVDTRQVIHININGKLLGAKELPVVDSEVIDVPARTPLLLGNTP